MHACMCVFAHVWVFAHVCVSVCVCECVCVCMYECSFCLLGDIFMGENYT